MENLKNKTTAILHWLEGYAKTDMFYLFRGGFWALLSQILVSLATFLLAITFAHFISKEAYGEYKYILSIASILGSFTLTGLGTSVTKSVAEGYEGTLCVAFWKNIKWSILFLLLALGGAIYYFVKGDTSLGIAMLFVGSFSPIISSTNLYNSYLLAKKDFRRSAIYFNIIGNIFPTLCIIVGIFLTGNPVWLVSIYFASNAFIGVILYLRIINIYRPNKKVDAGALGYGKHLSLMSILVGLADNIDQVLVFHYIGPVQLAIYNFAIAIPNQTKGPMKALAGLIFPKFSERNDQEIRSGMKNKFALLLSVGIVSTILYIILAPYIFHIFFQKYLDSILYSQILGLSFLGLFSIPAEIYLLVKGKIKEQYFMNIFMSVIQIAATFLFILLWGLMGIVIARVFIRLLRSLVSVSLYEKASKEYL